MPVIPETRNVIFYNEFTSTFVVSPVETTSTTETSGGETTVTEVQPISSSLNITSIIPKFEDPNVLITFFQNSATITGVYKRVIPISHTWRDLDYNLKTGTYAPEFGSYLKIVQVDSPPLQNKDCKFEVYSTFGQLISKTTSSQSSSSSSEVVSTTSTSVAGILTGTTILPVVVTVTTSTSGNTTVTDTTSETISITTTTQVDSPNTWFRISTETAASITTQTVKFGITTGTDSMMETYIDVVQYQSFSIINDRVLQPLLSNQPPDNE